MSVDSRQQQSHDEAVEAGHPGYIDPYSGLYVLTTRWLADRGHCCGNGCRHCPYSAEEQRAAGRVEKAG